VIYSTHPHCRIFTYQPFNTKAFWDFAAGSISAISHAEQKARLAYESMPEHLVAGLRGTYSDLRLEQRKEQDENARQLEQLGEHLTKNNCARFQAVLQAAESFPS
jgi:hypothetical protein